MSSRHLRLAWCEAIALPRRFVHLAFIVDPDGLRAVLDASVERHATWLDGDRENLPPSLHARRGSNLIIGQQLAAMQTARGNLVVSGGCVHGARNPTGHEHDDVQMPLNKALGSVRDRLGTMHRINGALRSGLSRLLVLHDVERWRDMPLEAEVEGSSLSRPGEVAWCAGCV